MQNSIFFDTVLHFWFSQQLCALYSGEHGIRTHVASIRRKPHFECGTFDLSDNSPLKFISDEFPTYIASAERNFHAMCSLRYSVSYISYVHRFRGAELSCDVLLNSIQNLHTFFKSLIL